MLYRLQSCEIDAARFELRRGGQTIAAEPQVLELLLYLIEHRGRAVPRTELFEQLWRGRIVGDAALNSRVKAARAAIGDDGTAQAQIRTLHRTGYRFVGPVEEVPSASAAAAAAARAALAAPPPEPPSAARGRLGWAGAALGMALAAGVFSLLPRAPEVGPSAAAASAAAKAPPSELAAGRQSLAVLPFANLSPDAGQDYLADGIGIELLKKLSHVPDLLVTGTVSSWYFRGRSDPPAAIGGALGVAHLLTGSVRRAGERVRVAVELVDAGSGYQLWSETYDRELGDIFDVQDEIAAHVATALQVKLGLGDSSEIGMTRNVAAYDEFLRGTAAYYQHLPESFPRAIEHMHRAIALDPGFSRAWAYLYCIHLDGSSYVPERSEEWRRRAREALDRARALTPDAPFVRLLDAREDMRFGRRLEAAAALDALPAGFWTADPYLTRDVFRGRFLLNSGYAQDAVESLERARAADPLSPVGSAYLAIAYAMAGDAKAALAETDRSREFGRLLPVLNGNALLLALGTRDEAEIRARVALVSDPAPAQRTIHHELSKQLGDPAAGRAAVRHFAAEPAPADFIRAVTLAHWAAYFGDTELALEHLAAIAHGSVDEGLLWRPVLSDVRKLAGFKDLVRREGLVDLWRATGWPELCRPTSGDDFECH